MNRVRGLLMFAVWLTAMRVEAAETPEPSLMLSLARSFYRPLPKKTPRTRPWAAGEAVEYLLKHQNENGSWPPGLQANPDAQGGITVATTALVCMALLEYESLKPEAMKIAVQKGLTFALENVYRKNDKMKSYEGYASPQWGLIYTIELLAQMLRRPPGNLPPGALETSLQGELADCVDRLLAYQGPAGTWGYSGSFKVGAAILALQHAKAAGVAVNEAKLAKAVTFLQSMRVEGVGYGYSYSRKPFESTPKEQAMNDGVARLIECEWALLQMGKVTPKEFEQAFENFMAHRDFTWKMRADAEVLPLGEDMPRGSGGTPLVFFTFFCSYYSTLGLEGLPMERRKVCGEALRQDLIAVVDEDGAWENVRSLRYVNPAPGSKMYSTAMALLSLKNIDRALHAK